MKCTSLRARINQETPYHEYSFVYSVKKRKKPLIPERRFFPLLHGSETGERRWVGCRDLTLVEDIFSACMSKQDDSVRQNLAYIILVNRVVPLCRYRSSWSFILGALSCRHAFSPALWVRSVGVLQDCDCHVAMHFFITYKNVCANDKGFYLGYVYTYSP